MPVKDVNDIQLIPDALYQRWCVIDNGNVVAFRSEAFCNAVANLAGTTNDDFHPRPFTQPLAGRI